LLIKKRAPVGLTTRALVLELLLMIDLYFTNTSKTRTANNKFHSPILFLWECYFFNSQSFKDLWNLYA